MKNLLIVFGLLAIMVLMNGCSKATVTFVPAPNASSPSVPSTPAIPSTPTVVNPNQGLSCNVYSILPSSYSSGTVNFPQMFQNGTLEFQTVLSTFDVSSGSNVFNSFTAAEQALIGPNNYAIDCSGFINVPAYGFYTFQLGSDDGSGLFLDYDTQILMPNLQAYTTQTKTLVLQQGLNPIEIIYFQASGTIGLDLQWQGPADMGLGSMSAIGSQYFTH